MVKYFCLKWMVVFALFGFKEFVITSGKRITGRVSEILVLDCPVNETFNSKSWWYNTKRLYTENTYLLDDGKMKLTSNYSLVLLHPALSDNGTYICMQRGSVLEEYNVEIKVSPNAFYLEVNNRNVSDGDHVVLLGDENITTSCHVVGARQANNLTWQVNNETVIPFHYSFLTSNNETFDIVSRIYFQPKTSNGTIACLQLSSDSTTEQNITVQFSTNETIHLNCRAKWIDLDVHGDKSRTSLFGFFVITMLVCLACIKGLTTSFHRKQSDLAVISSEVGNDSDFQMSLNADENTIEDVAQDAKYIRRDEVIMTSKLPGDGPMQYWFATCPSSTATGNIEFIAKCVSETAQVVNLLQFRTLAQQLLTLKKHDNIVHVLGVAADNPPYYIYHEYVECGTLRNYMLRNYQNKRDSNKVFKFAQQTVSLEDQKLHLTAFSVDVVIGMAYLFENNFRHPALTTSKVLITSSRKCKLYDFVPEEHAKSKLLQIIEKKNPPLAWLSPEMIFLRQYCEKADVWSLAVAVWEIFSLGETPYSGMSKEEVEMEIRNECYLSQPMCCPGAIYGMMLSSWDVKPGARPTFEQLQKHLTAIYHSMKQDDCSSNSQLEAYEDTTYFTLEESMNAYTEV
ncbi:hypothetical protein BSL78_12962 [Apostichopus japonicus]|uniref:Uncharacterized protein n=1 Tax=Stichopus japonicus TaxID=307972 RepID=A0A2G8KQ73_STIJA|nr:hypothetical protein BSL78_12962 [Apostichopus japonicus]